ncbi:hypothetical protein C1H46_027318 [Malus baccata]|uniref:PX domain-containing protein n=1 Tax=Malus baccata TaxID=106549 RepID=A0A540LL23_MALBA|nr:hypothetical protein C1H46_027318 [Malus baccata]
MEQQRSISGSSQSPRSPSSQPYLSVSVTDPVKLGNGVQAYISYRVITKTNFPEYQGPEKIVIRRYNDFVWLQDRLFEKYKGIFIPPLPEKSTVEKFRFSAEFIEMRRQALDVFVNRIASHHELQQSEDLRTFLQADEETMERLRFHETGIFKKPADWMQIFKLKAEGEEATRRFETIARLMSEEIVRFQEQKTTDMGVAFHEFAKGQARLANSIADAWRSLLPKLESCSPV